MADMLQHELDRVNSMTDDQLWTRYGKMNQTKKIAAFYEVLIKENRCKKLQMKIANDHRLSNESNTYHYLTNGIQNWRFDSTLPGNIQIGSQQVHDDTSVWQFNHVDYVNGQYPTDRAREFWNKLTKKGFVTCSLS